MSRIVAICVQPSKMDSNSYISCILDIVFFRYSKIYINRRLRERLRHYSLDDYGRIETDDDYWIKKLNNIAHFNAYLSIRTLLNSLFAFSSFEMHFESSSYKQCGCYCDLRRRNSAIELELGTNQNNDYENGLRSRISSRYSTCGQRKSKLRTQIDFLLCTIYIIITLTLSIATYIIYKHDRLLFNLTKQYEQFALDQAKNQTKLNYDCAILANMSQKYQSTYRSLEVASEQLEMFGYKERSQPGYCVLCYTIIGSIPMLFYFKPHLYFILGNDIRSESLAAILKPRLYFKLVNKQIDCIIDKFRHQGNNNWHLARRRANLTPVRHQPKRMSNDNEQETVKFRSLLDEVEKNKLAMPCTEDAKYLVRFIGMSLRILVAFILISSSFTLFVVIVPRINDLWQHKEQRLGDIRCKQHYGHQAIFAKPKLLGLDQLTSSDYEKYMDFYNKYHLNDIACFNAFSQGHYECFNFKQLYRHWSLVYQVDFRVYFDLASSIGFVTLILSSVLISMWTSLWSFLYVIEFCRINALLSEIKYQLEMLNECLANRIETNIELELVIIHIKLELFRQRFKYSQACSQFLLGQAVLFAVIGLTPLYVVVTTLDINAKGYVLFASFCLTCYINIYLFTASYTPRLLEKTIKLLAQFLAKVCLYRQDLQSTLAVEMCRRQLISNREIRHSASLSVAGVPITYTSLLTLDINIIGLWALMWHVQERLYSSVSRFNSTGITR